MTEKFNVQLLKKESIHVSVPLVQTLEKIRQYVKLERPEY